MGLEINIAGIPPLAVPLLEAVEVSAWAADYYLSLVRPLQEHDRIHSGNLMGTLACYLYYAGNATRAAKALYLHRSTLLHRLSRISALTSLDLADPYVRLALWMGVLLGQNTKNGEDTP
jgi:DNA-binding PucR family transcriptional regulator